MKVITYLGFTVLSIFIQFCVMDFIQEKIQSGEDAILNVSSQKETITDVLKNITSKPHALYYRTHLSRPLKNTQASKFYNNSTMSEVPLVTTDLPTTIFDVLYDENTSDTEATPTEQYSTTTEFDNITEITFFENKNKSSNVPSTTPKISFNKVCDCNLLFDVCDTHCCCDGDCSDYERKMFQCDETSKIKNLNHINIDGCISHLFNKQGYGDSWIENLFCIVKTNLPNKRSINKYNLASIGHYYTWQNVEQKQSSYEFNKTLYQQSDPIWLLKNGTIYYLDFPAPMINNYCTDRVPMAFLRDEKVQCVVKVEDLEMYNILKTSKESMVISATNYTFNSSTLNCSNLHCINWTILACHNGLCKDYNKSLDKVSCAESICSNLALKIDYNFYFYNLKIINATIKLHLQNVSRSLAFISQEVTVNFYITTKPIDQVVKLSGNPGYIEGLPVIVSYGTSNYTEHFYNTSERRSRLFFPENKNGLCVLSNTSKDIVKFGTNKRTKCRYVYPNIGVLKNKTEACKYMQNEMNQLLYFNVSVSPFGNPHDIIDDNWISLLRDTNNQEYVYGEYNENTSKLYCYNLINRVTIIFMFANVDERAYVGQNKILSTKCEVATKNLSFNIEDISTIVTMDVSFVDVTKPSIFEYAGSPNLNIHLPKDFFFPFPPSRCHHVSNTRIVTIYSCVIIFFANKITLE